MLSGSHVAAAALLHFDVSYSVTFVLLQSLRWCWVKCVTYHERDVREEQHHTYMWREQAIIE